jgi:thiol-disulfide isomerase/thioredoxin
VNAALLVARLVLAAVFGASGTAKLFDRAGTRATATAFGVPAPLAGPVALALPAAELAVAAALIPASSAALAGWAALALLAVFSAAVAVSLARGRRPDCHCFGQLTAAPIGWRTLARNVVLAAAAAFIAIGGWPDGGTSLGAVGATRTATVVAIGALALAVVVDTALVVLLLGRYGAVLHRLDQLGGAGAGTPGPAVPATGLPVGTPAPEFEVAGADGRPMTLTGLLAAGRPLVLVFSDPDCGPCQSLLPDIADWQAEHAGRFTTALISRGSMAENAAKTGRYELAHLGVQRDREVAAAYAYAGTPSAVAVARDGRIASQVVAGPDAVRALVTALLARIAADQDDPAGTIPAGTIPAGGARERLPGRPVPAAALADLDGRPVDLAAPREHPFVLLFWNPGCGFCQQALPGLKAREQGPVDFVFVSTGEPEANRAMGLRSLVLLDPAFATARAFGATGTPSAVLIGTDGRAASELAVGGPAVASLADQAISAAAGNPA